MKKLFLLSILISSIFAEEFIAKLDNIKNSIEIHRDTNTITNLKNNDILIIGDKIKTNKNSRVDIIFKDGTLVTLGEKSILSVNDYIYKPQNKKFKFDVYLDRGVAVYESGKISEVEPESIKFKIPTGTIGVRGTKFLVEVIEE